MGYSAALIPRGPRGRPYGTSFAHPAVTAAPEKGKANKAVVRLLEQALGLARGEVTITSGASSQDKTVRVGNVDVDTLRTRVLAAGL